MNFRGKRRRLWLLTLTPVALVLLAVPAGSIYYSAAGPKACIRCHEIQDSYHRWTLSTHRSVQCGECHDSIFTTDTAVHWNNVRQLWRHINGRVPERLQVRQADINRGLNVRCGKCHAQEYAAWAAGPHSASYGRIFLNAGHNTNRIPSDHCLQCHAMYFEGGIHDLLQPVDRQGPWRIATASIHDSDPSIPCIACHALHQPGEPLGLRPAQLQTQPAVHPANPPRIQPSLAFYDRREQLLFSAKRLPLPKMLDGNRPVRLSPDQRQATCYQCHAPDHTFQAGSGDDRTCVGVHEGLSCLACHQGHDQNTRASCANCHPRLSNCGLDVETMDTTFRSTDSGHNIHFVKCGDCHTQGVPSRRRL